MISIWYHDMHHDECILTLSCWGGGWGVFQGTEELEVRILMQARPGQDIRFELYPLGRWSDLCVCICVCKPYFYHISQTPTDIIRSRSEKAVCLNAQSQSQYSLWKMREAINLFLFPNHSLCSPNTDLLVMTLSAGSVCLQRAPTWARQR